MRLEAIKEEIERLELDENCEIFFVKPKEIEELGNEFPNYNSDIINCASELSNITVIKGFSKSKEKDIRLYYYQYENDRESLIQQLRTYNYREELESIERTSIDCGGEKELLDSGEVKYAYDENGIKNYAKIDDPFDGIKYLIYDEDGKCEFRIEEDYIEQTIKDGDKEYRIVDGYFEPTESGGISFLPLQRNAFGKLETEDIKRVVWGDISDEDKELIVQDLTLERKQIVLDAIDLKYDLQWLMQGVDVDEYEELGQDIEDENYELYLYNEEPNPTEVVEEDIKETIEKLRASASSLENIVNKNIEQEVDLFISQLLDVAGKKYNGKIALSKAKDLLSQYEKQLDKDGQTQDEE